MPDNCADFLHALAGDEPERMTFSHQTEGNYILDNNNYPSNFLEIPNLDDFDSAFKADLHESTGVEEDEDTSTKNFANFVNDTNGNQNASDHEDDDIDNAIEDDYPSQTTGVRNINTHETQEWTKKV